AGALPFESRLPVLEWTELIYASTYLLTALVPWIARTKSDLRTFCVRALWAMVVAFPLYLVVPLVAPPRPFTATTLPGRLLAWERTLDGPGGAFPSFHVVWALLAAEVFARRWPRLRWLCYAWAALIAASCVTTGQHPIVDVLGGAALALLVARGAMLWDAIRRNAERIANSWREWRTGPVRVINHGTYAGAGAMVALWIAGAGAGSGHLTAIFVAAGAAVVGAALWAQLVEGSPQLLRPYGFYGGLLGGTLGALAAPLFHTSPWLVLAAFSLGGPWAQAMGRLRCLVQGCCHGRPAPENVGIRYNHPRSRVCRMTAWTGVPLHPTPVYSILWNILIALAVTRLWTLATPLHFIAGMYFILTGLGRFVEEAWRGEPQTPALLGLRLYQWSAVASVLAGALMTAMGESGAAPALRFTWEPLPAAAVSGAVVAIAMGVDFPESNRRFSRLV
ncbi:MAG: phosphatase PAP2 family protein, partial [Acidobacteria bacterium]|nr:phosphatase PAP2 family protein [Acidobacteriota bacterium]